MANKKTYNEDFKEKVIDETQRWFAIREIKNKFDKIKEK